MKRKPFNVGPVTLRSMPFWCVGNPLADPFGSKVLESIPSVQTAEIICESANEGLIEATSFHDDDLVPWNPENLEDDLEKNSDTMQTLCEIKEMLNSAGVSVNTATCSLHGNPIFRNGGVTNPDPKIREIARKKVERTIRIGNFLGAKYFTYWVARDGFEVPVAVDWENVYKWLADGLNSVYDYIKRKKFTNYIGGTIEPKPNEPRGHMFIPTSGHAVGFILGKLKNPNFWGVYPELLQHESMALMNAVHTLGYLISMNKLSFLHFGSQIKAQFDNDFPPLIGPEGLKETVQMFWLLEKLGWKGVVEFDCHMLRCEANPKEPIQSRKIFIKNCVTALSICLELSSRIKKVNNVEKITESEIDLSAIMKMCAVDEKKIASCSVNS